MLVESLPYLRLLSTTSTPPAQRTVVYCLFDLAFEAARLEPGVQDKLLIMPVQPMLTIGDALPEAKFTYVPWTPQLENNAMCGMPQPLPTSNWKGKKVVLISVAGAFTPTCHMNHIPPFFEKLPEFRAKGVDVIAIISANDPFIMSAWGRVMGAKDEVLFLSDTYSAWSKSIGLELDLTTLGLGMRTRRYAIIMDDLVVQSLEFEPGAGVTVTSAESVLSRL